MMPDPEFYSQCLAESFEELRDEALEKRAEMLASTEQAARKAKRRVKRQTRRVHASRADRKVADKPPVRKAARKQPPPEAAEIVEAESTVKSAAGLTVVSDNTRVTVTHG
jgi:ATPase subunit of ABC transporter with duplicated ATPase domains